MTAIAQSWLDIQCGLIPGIAKAVVLQFDKSNRLIPSAVWPADNKEIPKDLLSAAEQVAKRGTAVVHTRGKTEEHSVPASIIASPLKGENGKCDVAVVEMLGQPGSKTQTVLQLLQWGTAWFQLLNDANNQDDSGTRLKIVADLLITSLEQERFKAAATITVTELANKLDCDRVSLGLIKKRKVEVEAVSHNAQIEKRSNILREIATAMEEAIDQDATVAYPPPANTVPQVSFAQEVLVERNNGNTVCSTPLYSGNKAVGAFTFECAKGVEFDKEKFDLCESLGGLLGPILQLKFQQDRSILSKLWHGSWRMLMSLLGFKYFALKLFLILFIAGFTYLYTQTGDFIVRAPATLEPAYKLFVTAPQAGYIENSEIRAGDLVKKGQLLAKLDAQEIELEKVRLQSEFEQLIMEKRAGIFNREDRSKVSIAAAQMKQNEARLKLLEEQLQRTTIISPFDGIIVSGDLTQSLGTPIEAGDNLFELAPLDKYRIRLDIDERDVGEIKKGERGVLALTGLPDMPIEFEVIRLLPVSEARDGKNFFQVEAKLLNKNELLRPGMKGIAKVDVDDRKLIWIWFHRVINWAKLQLWTWLG